jgi:hypothetical protein
LVAWAIENRVRMRGVQNGYSRDFCPVILGRSGGDAKVLVVQVGGGSSKGAVTEPAWRCFRLETVTDLTLIDGDWLTASRQHGTQSCVDEVDYDANPHSPYQPARSLGSLRDTPPPVS